jgi:2'-5' RNA ligase
MHAVNAATPVNVEHSIWLLAHAEQHAALRRRVEQLAPRHAGHVFEPHVTLQGEVPLDFAAACRLVDRLAAATPVLHWPVRAVESTEHYFRSLYLRLDAGPAFDAMRRLSAERSGTDEGLSPYAHLSLAYGATRGDAAALRERLGREHVGQAIEFDRLVLARSGQAVAIADWRVLHEASLAA